MRPTSYPLILASLLLNQVGGQDAQCVSLADGCSSGGVYEAAVRGAVAKFADSYLYGGQATDPVVFASALQGTTSAQIAYSCRDGSVPPVLDGRSIRTMLDKVARCPNLCGSVAISTSGQCGLGVLVAEGAGNASCWSLAVNVNPRGQLPDERPTVLGWNYLDCWADQSGQSVGQALANGPLTAPDMTLEKCLSVAAGHKYAGVQRGNQCFWGNDMSPLLTPATGQCNMACQGQPVDACGDEGRIGIYQDTNYQPSLAVVNPGVAGFSFRGCYVDSDSRIIQGQVYRDAQMTVAKCMQRAGTSRFAGVENGNECFYGSSLSAMQPNTGCSTACGGNSSEVCGGGWRLAVYENQQGRPPVVNPGIDSFENRGCFVDGETPETRVLPNVTEVQDMTVAKCLDHGRAASARYAAVQYGTECFYGDKMRNAIPGSGCDTPCGGDAGEACGGGWRLQVYEDADWVDPQVTLDMIRVGFGEVADLLAEFEQALDDWILGLSELPPLRAGDDVEVQVIPLLVARRLCMGITRPIRRKLQKLVRLVRGAVPRNLASRQHLRQAEELEMQYLLREPDVGRAASANLATTVGRELAGRVTLEIRKSISLTAGGVGVAWLVQELLKSIIQFTTDPDPDPRPPTTLPSATSTISTTTFTSGTNAHPTTRVEPGVPGKPESTSTSCTYTGVPTPVIFVTKEGTTLLQFKELIEPLPVVEGTWSYTFDWLKNWMHRTSMDRCQAEWLRKSPLVEAISIDKQGTNGDWMPSDRPQPPGAASDPNKAEMTGTGRRTFSNSSTSRTYSNSSIIRPHSNISVSLDGADAHRAPATQRLVMQQDSPAHLRWITSKHMQTRDAASGYWDIRDHVYDDRSATPPFLSGTTATVFVIDTAFAHYPEFSRKITQGVSFQWNTGLTPHQLPYHTGAQSSHGTCMASLAAGDVYGMAKERVNLVLIQVDQYMSSYASAVIWIAQGLHAQTTQDPVNADVRAVVSSSLGWDLTMNTWWDDNNLDVDEHDVLKLPIENAIDFGVVHVNSGGNSALGLGSTATFYGWTPHRNGADASSLIMVGNADWAERRNSHSTFLDPLRRGVLSIFAMGTDVDCVDNLGQTMTGSGTSNAAAIVAGAIAYIMQDPYIWPEIRRLAIANANGRPPMSRLAFATKRWLQAEGSRLRLDIAVEGQPNDVAALSLDVGIRCNGVSPGTFPDPASIPQRPQRPLNPPGVPELSPVPLTRGNGWETLPPWMLPFYCYQHPGDL